MKYKDETYNGYTIKFSTANNIGSDWRVIARVPKISGEVVALEKTKKVALRQAKLFIDVMVLPMQKKMELL